MEIEGFLLDIDGTLWQDDEAAIPGAVETVEALARRGVPRRYLTNATRRSRRALAERLVALGFPIHEDELFTAAVSAARWLEREGIERVALFLPESTHEDFGRFRVTDRAPEAVVVGDLGRDWDFDTLNRAFHHLLDGARLVALQRNRYWRTAGELALDAGPFIAALEYAVETEAAVVGKPSEPFFRLGADALGLPPERIAVVGDDVETDVAGARAAGMYGLLVRTGKYSAERLARSGTEPDAVIDSVADITGLIG